MVDSQHKRRAFDYYPTPAWCVARLFEVPEFTAHLESVYEITEPFAGDGAIVRALARRIEGAHFHAWEIQERFRPKLEACAHEPLIGDAFKLARKRTFDLTISNPPNFAIEKTLSTFVPRSKASAFFLPLSRLAGVKNGKVHDRFPPSIVQTFRTRPRFISIRGAKRSGFLDYAWFIYLPEWKNETIVRWARPYKRGAK